MYFQIRDVILRKTVTPRSKKRSGEGKLPAPQRGQQLFTRPVSTKNNKIKHTYNLRFTTLRKHFCNVEAIDNNIERRTGVYKVLKSLQFLKRQSQTEHQEEPKGLGMRM